jgi:hypothetical protein
MGHHFEDLRLRLEGRRVFLGSNHARTSWIGRPSVALANDDSGVAGPRWRRHWISSELGSLSPRVSGTHQVFVLRSQSDSRSSPGSCLSGRGTETRHATARLVLWPWAIAGGGSKGWTSSGTDQMRVVEVVDGR